jgi:membrane-associated phospholipid phosphatase
MTQSKVIAGPGTIPVHGQQILAIGLVLFGVGLTVTALVAIGGGWSVLQSTDSWWYATMVDLRWGPFVDLSRALGRIFQSDVTWPIRVLVTLLIALRRDWQALTGWLISLAVSELCIGPAKAIIDRPRPEGSLVSTSGESYPSGHAIVAAVMAVGIAMAFGRGRWWRRGIIIAVTVTIAVALSRSYLSAHWLSDVVGGALIGTGLALAIPETLAIARERTSSPTQPRTKTKQSQATDAVSATFG